MSISNAFRSPLILSTTLILLTTAAIVQFTQTQVPTKGLSAEELQTDRLSHLIADAEENSEAIDATGSVWCSRNLQNCPN